jgi:hypothetical protein
MSRLKTNLSITKKKEKPCSLQQDTIGIRCANAPGLLEFSGVAARIGTPESKHVSVDRHTEYLECDNDHTEYRLHSSLLRIVNWNPVRSAGSRNENRLLSKIETLNNRKN